MLLDLERFERCFTSPVHITCQVLGQLVGDMVDMSATANRSDAVNKADLRELAVTQAYGHLPSISELLVKQWKRLCALGISLYK